MSNLEQRLKAERLCEEHRDLLLLSGGRAKHIAPGSSRRSFLRSAAVSGLIVAAGGLLVMPRKVFATTFAESFGTSTAWTTVNVTSWTQATTISVDALNIAGLSPVPYDLMATLNFTFPNSAPANQKAINWWLSPSEDGTHYADNDQYAGSNNTQAALRSPSNFFGPLSIPVTQNIAMVGVLPSVLTLLGAKTLPRKIGSIWENQGGQTIATPSATYTPINFTNL